MAPSYRHGFLLLSAFFFPPAASAGIVTFEEVAPPGGLTSGIDGVPGGAHNPFEEAGIRFTTNGQFFLASSTYTTAGIANGTGFAFFQNGAQQLDIEMISGEAFRLVRFDAGQAFHEPPGNLYVTGYFDGGGSISAAQALQGNTFNSYAFSSEWTGLVRVRLLSEQNFVAIDNVTVAAVPEPSSLALALVMSAIGFSMRRRKRRSAEPNLTSRNSRSIKRRQLEKMKGNSYA